MSVRKAIDFVNAICAIGDFSLSQIDQSVRVECSLPLFRSASPARPVRVPGATRLTNDAGSQVLAALGVAGDSGALCGNNPIGDAFGSARIGGVAGGGGRR